MPDTIRETLGLDPAAATPWTPQRRPARDCDSALTGTARQWLRRLPPRRRPLRLCEAHPRVANRIAWCWGEPALVTQVLEDLLVDRRGGRRGFAAPVTRELQRLREYNGQRAEPQPSGLWANVRRSFGFG